MNISQDFLKTDLAFSSLNSTKRILDVIHYCWFGEGHPSRFERNCIDSWKKQMPECSIKCWGKDDFDIGSIPFVKKAFEAKSWAFVADYIRLYALYTEGGIYMDTDVKMYKSLSPFQIHNFFIPTQVSLLTGYNLMSAIIGSIPSHPFLKVCLDYYAELMFERENIRSYVINPIMSRILFEGWGYEYLDKTVVLKDDIYVLSRSLFDNISNINKNINKKEYYAIHYCNQSWVPQNRGWLYKFCKKNDLMSFYIIIESLITKK